MVGRLPGFRTSFNNEIIKRQDGDDLMTINDRIMIGVSILTLIFLLFLIAYLLYSLVIVIADFVKIRRLKIIMLNIISKEDNQKALDIISGEYAKAKLGDLSFDSLIGKIATELRSGSYSKYYKEPIEEPCTLAERIDAIQTLNNDKNDIVHFKQSGLINELGLESDKQVTKQDMLMAYSKINAYYLGRIHEKNTEIDALKKKLTTKSIGRVLSILGWIIGVVSGILTIVMTLKTFFK